MIKAPIPTEKKLKNNSIDEQTSKRIHEHLTNEHDVISDADITNAKTDLSYSSEDKQDETSDNSIIDNSDIEIETPWNILEN